MGRADLTEEQITMRYPPSILEWEMKHGIARYERNGMLYVCATRPFEEVIESISKEREQKETRRRLQNRGDAN